MPQYEAGEASSRLFFSNALVGGMTGLALFLLFWPLISFAIARLRAT